jgi:UTP--glucose-1-phosphate uridylyltransferase
MGSVDDAIILAGGRGTRMLPASLFMPKETMPLVDTPIINHLLWEANKAGVKRIHLVLSQRKKDILEQFIVGGPIHDGEVRPDLPRHSLSMKIDGVEIIPHIQVSAGGVADAISVALEEIDGPFLVILGDMLILEEHLSPSLAGPDRGSSASKKLVESFEESGRPCVGVIPVEMSEVSNYGVAQLKGKKISDIVEKPIESEAPSNYVLCGRYLFPRETKAILGKYPISEFGELQSIFLMRDLIGSQGLDAVKFDKMSMYDSGDPIIWLKSQIDHALRREDLGSDLSKWFSERTGGY